jgi:16S rRNA (cytosine967-C5)-methyltransferase
VIRRHPDIKVLRRPEDIDALAVRQLALLEKLWDCLAPGGRLLYTTCSVLRQENDDTLATFVSRCPDAKFQAIAADWGVKCRYGRQLLPDSTASDGFYFALLEKGSQLSG